MPNHDINLYHDINLCVLHICISHIPEMFEAGDTLLY